MVSCQLSVFIFQQQKQGTLIGIDGQLPPHLSVLAQIFDENGNYYLLTKIKKDSERICNILGESNPRFVYMICLSLSDYCLSRKN